MATRQLSPKQRRRWQLLRPSERAPRQKGLEMARVRLGRVPGRQPVPPPPPVAGGGGSPDGSSLVLTLPLALQRCGVQILFETTSYVLPEHSQSIGGGSGGSGSGGGGVRVSTGCRPDTAVHAASALWQAGLGLGCVCARGPASPELLAAIAEADSQRSALIVLLVSGGGTAGAAAPLPAESESLRAVCKHVIAVDETTDAPSGVLYAAVRATSGGTMGVVVLQLLSTQLTGAHSRVVLPAENGILLAAGAASRRLPQAAEGTPRSQPQPDDPEGGPVDADVAAVLGAIIAHTPSGSLPIVCAQPGRCTAAAVRHLGGCRLLKCPTAGAAVAAGLGVSLGCDGEAVAIVLCEPLALLAAAAELAVVAQCSRSTVVVVLSDRGGPNTPDIQAFSSAIAMAYSAIPDRGGGGGGGGAEEEVLERAIDWAAAGTPNLVECTLPGFAVYGVGAEAAAAPAGGNGASGVLGAILGLGSQPAGASAAAAAAGPEELGRRARDAAAVLQAASRVHIHVTARCGTDVLTAVAEKLDAIVSTTPGAKGR
eukprot:SAG22_NODE_1641_length_3909_cov_1.422047_1_plen_540_part_00